MIEELGLHAGLKRIRCFRPRCARRFAEGIEVAREGREAADLVVETTALEAARIVQIGIDIRRRLIAEGAAEGRLVRLVVDRDHVRRELEHARAERFVDRDRGIEPAAQLRNERLVAAIPGLVFPGIAEAASQRELRSDLVGAFGEDRLRAGTLRVAQDVGRVVPVAEGQGPAGKIEEAEDLRHAEIHGLALVEPADHRIERRAGVGGKAQFLLEGLAVVVTRRIEERERRAVLADRRCTRIGVRDARELAAPAGDRGQLAEIEIVVGIQIEAVDRDPLAVLHLDEAVLTERDGRVVERVTARRVLADHLEDIGEERGIALVAIVLVDRRHGLGTIAQIFILREDAEAAGRLPQQLATQRGHVLAACTAAVEATRNARVVARHEADDRAVAGAVAVVAVRGFRPGDNAQSHVVENRDIRGQLQLAGLERTELEAAVHADLAQLGALGLDRHRAAGGVLAEQRALRPAQNFDLRHIEGVEQLGLHRRHHEIVDEHRNRRLEVDDDRGLTDAAHRERGGVEVGDRVGREVRHEGGEITDIARARLADQVGVDRGNRDRGALQVRTAPRGGHHDLVQAIARHFFGARLRLRRLRWRCFICAARCRECRCRNHRCSNCAECSRPAKVPQCHPHLLMPRICPIIWLRCGSKDNPERAFCKQTCMFF